MTRSPDPNDPAERPSPRRSYESPIRRQRAAETHERIVAAGSELVHGFPSWDWRGLTMRAVAQRAGVNERTVYRHFSSERELHDAVMRRLVEEADVELEGLRLEEVGDVTRRIFAYLASFPVTPRSSSDPTFADVDERRRAALLDAVTDPAGEWSEDERRMAAAMLDVLWGVPTYERLIAAWNLDPDQAATAVAWIIGLLETAVREGRRPGS